MAKLTSTMIASCSLGAVAFTSSPVAPRSEPSAHGQITSSQPTLDGTSEAPAFGHQAAAAVLSAAAVAIAAKAGSGRRLERVARNAKVVEYVDGKARFVVDEASAAAAAAMKPQAFVAKGQLGAQAPLGFWDPLGYCEGITEMDFKKLRSSEIKHGRLAMMATIGFITPFYSKLPGYLSLSKDIKFEDIPVGITAISKVPAAGWVQILLFAAICEFGFGPNIQEWKDGQPGDYGRGALGMFGPITDPVKKARSLSAEISNGRLAMAAITGMILQNGITGGTDSAMWFGSSP